MLEIEPKSLIFRDIRLNQAYTNTICITNPLSVTVDFTIRASSPRYNITPNRVTLNAGQSMVITVRLFISHYPNPVRASRGQEDVIHIKSAYFEQNVVASFFLHNHREGISIGNAVSSARSSSRSPSPASR
jgi:hypothetical protein